MKRLLSAIAIGMMTIMLAACGAKEDSSQGTADKSIANSVETGISERNLNFFCIQSEATTYYQSAVKFADMMKEASDGKINIEVYANGSLSGGDQAAALEMIQKGSIDMGLVTAAVCGNMINDLRVTLIPFVFDDYAEVDKALLKGSALYDCFASEFDGIDMHMLGIAEHGFRELTVTKKTVKTPEDIKGLKIRVLSSPVLVDFFNAMGVNVTDIVNTEIYTSLQNGTIDAQENPLVQSYLSDFISAAPYVTIWDYCYDAHPFLLSNKLWNSFSKEEQELFETVTDEWITEQRTMMRDAYQDAYDNAVEKGATITELTDDEKQAFIDIAASSSAPYISELSDAYSLLQDAVK